MRKNKIEMNKLQCKMKEKTAIRIICYYISQSKTSKRQKRTLLYAYTIVYPQIKFSTRVVYIYVIQKKKYYIYLNINYIPPYIKVIKENLRLLLYP